MTVTILSFILFLIFTALAGFHFYWFFGGTWGIEKVFPTKIGEASNMTIPKFATLVVAFGLLSFGLIYLKRAGFMDFQVPNWVNYGYWIIPAVFILRAIGEFNYVGFFKKVKDTEFANADSKVFAPLCLFIGIVGILIQLLDN